MTAAELICKFNLPEQTLMAIQKRQLPKNHNDLKASFFTKTSLFSSFAKSDPDGLSVLSLYLHWAVDTKKLYDRVGIPEEYFWDSMKDIAIWCEDYLPKHGVPGFKEWEWVGRSLRLEVTRIGRLQFEPISLKQTLELDDKTYSTGTPMLDVHIPAGEPLSVEAAIEAMHQAPIFFNNYFGRTIEPPFLNSKAVLLFPLLHCHSWLLSPDLKNLLPEHSRIIQFQNLFTVYKTDNEERQAEERVFGFLSDDPGKYPETTSLQRSVKEYMLAGKTVMMGAGIRKAE